MRSEDNIAKFTESWLEQLKSKSDIVDVLGEFLYLERKGANLWACCPFHKEKTPSFSVKQDGQFYHCFGCGKSGNVITFLMEHERLSYTEAVEWLAKRANMPLPDDETPEQKSARRKREKGLECLRLAARFYFGNLYAPEGRPALDYINSRGLSEETVKTFGIGYSVNYTDLPSHLAKAGYSDETMIYTGVVSANNGRVSDFEAGRLIIPIINEKSQVIAFGGRRIDGGKEFKYKNTSATAIFDKRRNLYNLNTIKKLQQKENINALILVEGYMDVISLFQAGIKNAIASMGTSLTKEQCDKIKKFTNNVFVCFDGDGAGQIATMRSLDMLAGAGLEVRVVSLPQGLDPDDTVKRFGKEGFLDIVDKALPLIDFKLKALSEKFNLNTLDGKNRYANAALDILADLDPIARDAYITRVSEYSLLSEDSIKNSLADKLARGVKPKVPKPAEKAEQEKSAKNYSAAEKARIIAARFLLSSILSFKDYVDIKEISPDFFEYPPHKEIFAYILRQIDKNTPPEIGALFDLTPEYNAEINKLISASDDIPAAERRRYYADSIKLFEKFKRAERIKELTDKISAVSDGDEKDLLKQELRKLINNK